MTALVNPIPSDARPRRTGCLTALIALCLIINFLLRLPTAQVADWGQFAFYDPGTVLKGDILLAKGYVPTVDFGYTHGLLALLYGRIGFAIFGRTPAAFLLLTLLTELLMAWALARIFVALEIGRLGFILFFVALPMAIMPAYLTLAHPLEAMLILLALAAQAEGKPARSLALMTVCLFVKPSMAYIYGFLLVFIIIWQTRGQWKMLLRQLLPAFSIFIVLFACLAAWTALMPVVRTLLPATGAKTYAATHFGFFNQSGREFWWPANPLMDFLTPAALFLLAAAVTAGGALWSATRLFHSKIAVANTLRSHELLLTIAVLHTAFLLGFYGWSGSWTYYSYLPILGLCVAVTMLPLRRGIKLGISIAIVVLIFLSNDHLAGDIYNGWHFKTRTAETAALWADPEQLSQWHEALSAADESTLLMSNGYLPNLPPNIHLPDAWFPEPGIPTPSEIARVEAQADASHCVILWWEYRNFDLWNSPDFANIRNKFHAIYQNERFTVLEQK